MNPVRLVLALVFLLAIAGGLYLFSGDPPPQPVVEIEVPKSDTQEVLVAARDIPVGAIISDLDLRWVVWPNAAIGPIMISKTADPVALQALKGSIVRVALMEGEPVRRSKLVKGANAGFLSAILPSGLRAVSISIDGSGTTNAGGFVLPNDRVDVVRAVRGADGARAEVILSDVLVLAIGRAVQEQPGPDRTVQGVNATLQVTPEQANDLIVAQQSGGLSLVLRSLLDAGRPTPVTKEKDTGVSIIKFGAESRISGR